MAQSASTDRPIALGISESDYIGRFKWMVPVLIGMSAPLLFAVLVIPTLLDEARGFATVVLTSIVFLCAGIVMVATVLRGDAVGAVIKAREGVVDVLYENMFATRAKSIPFADIVNFDTQVRNDRDGYSYTGATLVLASGTTIDIIASLSPEEISAARQLIGIRGRGR